MLQGHFQYGEDNGLPAGHESLKCLSSAMPRWIGDAHWDNKVRLLCDAQLLASRNTTRKGHGGGGGGGIGMVCLGVGCRAKGGKWLCLGLLPDSPDRRTRLHDISTQNAILGVCCHDLWTEACDASMLLSINLLCMGVWELHAS